MKQSVLFLLLTFLIMACSENNMKTLPSQSEAGFYTMVVEIPAGTNKKYEFDSESMTFEIDQRDGKDRVISFLPYFGNYGFIPSTLSDKAKGGDGDPVDIIVLSEALPQGAVLSVLPLGTVKLIDNNEEDYKVIAVPADEDLNVLGVTTLEELQEKHPSIIQIIEIWLKNYDSDSLEIQGWLNKKETIDYIQNNRLTN